MIASIIATLLITECIFRLVSPQNLTGSWFVSTDNGLLVNKSSGTSKHQLENRIVRYSFYEPNFRGTPIKEDGIKILVVGDSFTFGLLLEEEDTYVHHLQQFTDMEFGEGVFQYLNAAVGGWGTADYVAYIEDFRNIVKPDIILVFFNGMDINRSVNRGIYTLSDENKLMLKRHILKPPKLKYIINSIPCYQWLIENSHLAQFVKASILTRQYNNKIRKQTVSKKKLAKKLSAQSNVSHEKSNDLAKQTASRKELAQKPTSQSNISHDNGSNLVKALFKRLKIWCDTNHISLCVTTTGWYNMSHALGNTSEFFQSIEIPFIDIAPSVSGRIGDNRSEFIFQGDGHPNEKGSKLIADMSWKFFIKNQLHEYYRTKENSNIP
tara:strand:+ start:342 stop:1481 length:1140 start_codon:yes stop_codon:yes gene_type:complete